MSNHKIIHIDSFAIPLERVSIPLQERYRQAELAVAAAPAGPMKNKAKAELNKVTRDILLEQTPHLTLKASPKAHGARGFFEMLNKRVA
jgi:hypothetical protein